MRKLVIKLFKVFTTKKFWKALNSVIWGFVVGLEVFSRWFGK